MTSTTTALATILAFTVSATAAHAAVIFDVERVGGDVLVTASGSYDLTGAVPVGVGVQDGFINGSLGLAVGGPFGAVDFYQLTLNPGAFGTGGFVNGVPDTGDRFGLDIVGGFITVPSGYVSGTPLAGTTRFSGHNLASLGLTPGTFVYGIPNDTLTVNVAPEPATIALFGLGVAGAGWARRRMAARG